MSSSRVNLEKYLIPLEEINRATQNFSEERRIGDGGFGAVYKGQLSQRWQNRTAAIKRLGQDSYQGEREFYNELEMISRFHHENIISFMGYCDEEGEMIIVYHYAINGSLDQHLQDPNKMRCLTWPQRLMICIGAAKGLNYLHSGLGEHQRVIHRDVKSANILLDNNLVAKICDFGLSKPGPRNQPNTELYTKVAGTRFYLDPTYQESGILKKESDVYSFGVVLFEILSGMLVYRERNIGDVRQFLMHSVRRYHLNDPEKIIDPHIRYEIDFRSFDIFKEIAFQCISLNLEERPTLDTVIEKIEEALTVHTSLFSTSTPAGRSTIKILLRKLKSGIPYYQRTAAHEICLLSFGNTHNRIIFAKAGAIPLLTDLLTVANSRTQERAVAALYYLSISIKNKVSIAWSGALPGIVQVLKEGSMEARMNAADTLYNLSLMDENRAAIGDVGAIPPLLLLLSEGTLLEKKSSVSVLCSLCIYEGNKTMAVRAGIVPILIELLKERQGCIDIHKAVINILSLLSFYPEGHVPVYKAEVVRILVEAIGIYTLEEPQSEIQELATAFLARLSVNLEGVVAIGKAEVVPFLVEAIWSGSSKSKINAAKVLVKLGSLDQKYLVEAQEHGVIGKLMHMLEHGIDLEKRAAKDLLRLMPMVRFL